MKKKTDYLDALMLFFFKKHCFCFEIYFLSIIDILSNNRKFDFPNYLSVFSYSKSNQKITNCSVVVKSESSLSQCKPKRTNASMKSVLDLLCFDPLIFLFQDELVKEIRTMCHKNVQSIKSLKIYNIPNIEFKISEIQSKAARFFSISNGELKKLPLPKLEKVRIKCANHIDKLLDQERYLQQLSSKCSFLQENCVTLKDDSDEETPEIDKSESLTAILRLSNANLSQMTIPESDSECSNSSKAEERVNNNSRISKRGDSIREESPKVSKREYDNLFNEHMKALETIKELKRKIVQKHEEENLGRLGNNGKKNNEQKENNIRKNTNSYGVQHFFFFLFKYLYYCHILFSTILNSVLTVFFW